MDKEQGKMLTWSIFERGRKRLVLSAMETYQNKIASFRYFFLSFFLSLIFVLSCHYATKRFLMFDLNTNTNTISHNLLPPAQAVDR